MRRREKMRKNFYVLFAALMLASLVLAACGGGTLQTPAPAEEPPAPAERPAEESTSASDPMGMYAPEAVSGDIVIAGSSTIFPKSIYDNLAWGVRIHGYKGGHGRAGGIFTKTSCRMG